MDVPTNKDVYSFPGVTVIVATNRPEYMERLLANYQRQNYPNKEFFREIGIIMQPSGNHWFRIIHSR